MAKQVSTIESHPERSYEFVVQNGLKAVICRLDHRRAATISRECGATYGQELNEKVCLRRENYWAVDVEVHGEHVYFVYFRWVRSKKFGHFLQCALKRTLKSTLGMSWKIVYHGSVYTPHENAGIILRNAILNKQAPTIEVLIA